VVDQHTDAADLAERPLGHALDLVPRRNVALHEERLAAGGAHALGSGLRARGRSAVVHDDARALLRRPHGELGAEAGARSGHHDRLLLEAAPHQITERPPSMYRTCPVTKLA